MIIQVLPKAAYLRFQRQLSGIGAGIEYTHIARILHPIAGPITVYTKLYEMPSKPLMNEILGYLLARALDLPQPRLGFLALIPIAALEHPPTWVQEAQGHQDLWPAWCTQQVDGGKAPGILFNLKAQASLEVFKKDLMKWTALPQVLGFDEWIANIDRHFNNLLRLGTAKYAIIDHGRLVVNSGHWQARDANPRGAFCNRLIQHLWAYRPPLPIKSQMIQAAEKHAQLLAEVEEELMGWANMLLSENDAAAITGFLRERARLGPGLIRQRYQMLL